MAKALTRQRRRLFQRDPHCYWCGKLTVFSPGHKGAVREDMATIDHLRPRHHPGRLEPVRNGEVRRVLSCWKCNNSRDHDELAAKPKDWFYENGGARPLSQKTLYEVIWIALKLEFDLQYARPRSGRGRRRARRLRESLEYLKAEINRRKDEEDVSIGGTYRAGGLSEQELPASSQRVLCADGGS